MSMTNQQGAPEAPSYEHQRAIMEGERNASLDAYSRVVYLTQTESRIYEAAFTNGWNRLAALVEAQQPTPSVAAANVCTDCNNADSWGLPDKPCCRTCTGSSNWEPLNKSSVHPNAQTAAPQPSPTAQADSQPAPDEAVAMNRTRDLAEDGRWPSDWVEAYRRGYSDCAARAPADSVTAPAGGVSLRDEFEAHWRRKYAPLPMNTRMRDDGRYGDPTIQQEWEAWQAAAPPAQAADSVLEDAAPQVAIDNPYSSMTARHEAFEQGVLKTLAAFRAKHAARKQGGA